MSALLWSVLLALRTAVLAAALALGTIAFGWWAVPVIAFLWGMLARGERGAALTAGVAAMLAWGSLLLRDAGHGPVDNVASTLGQLFGVTATAVYVLTVALPGLLALTAAIVGRGLRR